MKYRMLGGSDLRVSVIGFGTWQLGDDSYWGTDSDVDAHATVHAAVDAGINFFDTAEMYGDGRSEEVLGQLLGKKRDDVYVATKFSMDKLTPAQVRSACEASLKRLNTDYIDLYQVHWPLPDQTIDGIAEELNRLKAEGKIRHVGISNFGVKQMARWCENGEAVSNQLAYNLIFRAIEDAILPDCIQRDIGVIAYMPLMQGLLAGAYDSVDDIPPLRRRTRHFASHREGTRHTEPGAEEETFAVVSALKHVTKELDSPMAQVALAWLLHQTGVSTTIVGARKPNQLARNIDAVDLQLPADALQKLDEASTPLRTHMAGNADMWDSGDAARVR